METIVITDGDLQPLFDAVNEKAGKVQAKWKALAGYYNICIQSVITEYTMRMWQLYQFTNGLSNETYNSFMELPIKTVEAVNVIRSEVNRIEQLRANDAKARANMMSKGKSHGR